LLLAFVLGPDTICHQGRRLERFDPLATIAGCPKPTAATTFAP
jgi:hypothetical protein